MSDSNYDIYKLSDTKERSQNRQGYDRFDYSILPLRVFLGITFIFAGLQKLANPAFFNPNSPISIQQQFKAYSHHSPIGSFLIPLHSYAGLIGFIIALAELSVGIGTIIGLFSRIAAVGGLLISLSLFLTVSFHSNPYFTGSDIVFFLVVGQFDPTHSKTDKSVLSCKALPASKILLAAFISAFSKYPHCMHLNLF